MPLPSLNKVITITITITVFISVFCIVVKAVSQITHWVITSPSLNKEYCIVLYCIVLSQLQDDNIIVENLKKEDTIFDKFDVKEVNQSQVTTWEVSIY